MAETLQEKTHKKAKGKTKNGKPGRATTRRPRATAKLIRKREKTPPAPAEKKQKPTDCKAGDAGFVPAGIRGVDLLRRRADEYLLMHFEELIEGIGEKACEGHNGDFKVLVGLANETPAILVASPDRAELTGTLEKLDSEPEYKQREDSETHHNQDSGEFPEAGSSARRPEL